MKHLVNSMLSILYQAQPSSWTVLHLDQRALGVALQGWPSGGDKKTCGIGSMNHCHSHYEPVLSTISQYEPSSIIKHQKPILFWWLGTGIPGNFHGHRSPQSFQNWGQHIPNNHKTDLKNQELTRSVVDSTRLIHLMGSLFFFISHISYFEDHQMIDLRSTGIGFLISFKL